MMAIDGVTCAFTFCETRDSMENGLTVLLGRYAGVGFKFNLRASQRLQPGGGRMLGHRCVHRLLYLYKEYQLVQGPLRRPTGIGK